jgi:hypothetical protein
MHWQVAGLVCLEVVGPRGQHEQRSAEGTPQHDGLGAARVRQHVVEALLWRNHISRAGAQNAHRQRRVCGALQAPDPHQAAQVAKDALQHNHTLIEIHAIYHRMLNMLSLDTCGLPFV